MGNRFVVICFGKSNSGHVSWLLDFLFFFVVVAVSFHFFLFLS